MRPHAVMAAVLALVCAACEPQPIDDVAVDAHIGDYRGGCRGIDPPLSSAGMEAVAVLPGYQVMAEPGVLSCEEPEGRALACTAQGPGRIHVHTDVSAYGYELLEGEIARFTIGPDGANCNVRAER